MKQPETATVFAGVDGRAIAQLPHWYEAANDPEVVVSSGDVVFGEIRQYRGGGEAHVDAMFDSLVDDTGERTPGELPLPTRSLTLAP